MFVGSEEGVPVTWQVHVLGCQVDTHELATFFIIPDHNGVVPFGGWGSCQTRHPPAPGSFGKGMESNANITWLSGS